MSVRSSRWLAAATLALLAPEQVLGHAAELDASLRTAVEVEARFEDGTPMAAAQITVFAPNDPAEPWLQGLTDATGRFVFVPGDHAGYWSVRVRQAGHGAMVHVDPGEPVAAATPALLATSTDAPDRLQKLLMAASIVWGCIGTALYCRRRSA